ncbi:hypothetical protein [Pseudonocardia sp. ICBG162]|uniref:hypothetical protein n=1 Tax=Pseudonocardia sp. ICBG162 TaxID=2846761 RepID=UPI001CF64330|nr:hypothetical protein [Pseudonocardia sp. ICBG162]
MTRATTMSPFRLFGRTARDERPLDDGPDPWLDDPAPAPAPRPAAPRAREAAPAPSTGGTPAAPVAEGPATAAARPAVWTPRRPPQEPVAEPEPVTDPFGFPPVPPAGPPPAVAPVPATAPVSDEVAAAWAAWAPAATTPVDGTQGSADPGVPPSVPDTAAATSGPAPADPGSAAQSGPATPAVPSGPASSGSAATTPALSGPALSGPALSSPAPSGRGGPADRASGSPAPGRAAAEPVAVPAAVPGLPDPGAAEAAPGTVGAGTPGPVVTDHGPASRSAGAPVGATPGPVDPTHVPPRPDHHHPEVRPAGTAPSPLVDPAEASALAGAFAADLLSWDEDDVARRGRVLAAYLPTTVADGLLGWTGTGRQRADLVLPGRVRTDGDRAVVDVRVRVVPYRRVDARGTAAPEPEPDDPIGAPAGAPAPAARGWRGLAARWVRLEVGVVLSGDGLVVDAGPATEPARRPSPVDLARGGAR